MFMEKRVSNTQTSILIIDRTEIVHFGLRKLIIDNFNNILIEDAYNLFEAVKKINVKIYDVIIVDFSVSSKEGQIIYSVLKSFKKSNILVFTSEEGKIRREQLIKMNIKGYILKSSSTKQILNALSIVMNGKRHFTNLKFKYEREFINIDRHKVFPLTFRETQIVKLLISGEKSKNIADLLGIHTSTLGTHKSRIMAKLNVPNIIKLREYIEEHEPELL